MGVNKKQKQKNDNKHVQLNNKVIVNFPKSENQSGSESENKAKPIEESTSKLNFLTAVVALIILIAGSKFCNLNEKIPKENNTAQTPKGTSNTNPPYITKKGDNSTKSNQKKVVEDKLVENKNTNKNLPEKIPSWIIKRNTVSESKGFLYYEGEFPNVNLTIDSNNIKTSGEAIVFKIKKNDLQDTPTANASRKYKDTIQTKMPQKVDKSK